MRISPRSATGTAAAVLLVLGFASCGESGTNPDAPDPPGFHDEEFVLIEAGTFQMGDIIGSGAQRELPVHTVNITRPFYLQKTEVTQAQWESVMGSNPSVHTACGGTCPVENVSWNDIQGFINELNRLYPGRDYRLPTEAEWEYAARAGTTGEYGGTGVLDEMGWYRDNSGATTHPVAQKLANDWGLYDMHGNVWEWVQDWHADDYYAVSPTDDPPGASSGTMRGVRGGGYSDIAHFSRSAHRLRHYPSFRIEAYGFRLARSQ